MKVIKPVKDCEECQSQFRVLSGLYTLYKVQPQDPAAIGLLQQAIINYNKHHVGHVPSDYLEKEAKEKNENTNSN